MDVCVCSLYILFLLYCTHKISNVLYAHRRRSQSQSHVCVHADYARQRALFLYERVIHCINAATKETAAHREEKQQQ